jgi:hypothetical protein
MIARGLCYVTGAALAALVLLGLASNGLAQTGALAQKATEAAQIIVLPGCCQRRAPDTRARDERKPSEAPLSSPLRRRGQKDIAPSRTRGGSPMLKSHPCGIYARAFSSDHPSSTAEHDEPPKLCYGSCT